MEPNYLYSVHNIHETDWPQYYSIDLPSDMSDTMKRRLQQNKEKFVVRDGQVWRKVMIDNKPCEVQFCPFSRRADLVDKFHSGFGHAGRTTVYELLRRRWWWPSMQSDIQTWLSHCPQCQLAAGANKNTHHAPMVVANSG
ncbi:hypothetical protein G6F57_019751 [Rhizopus arrhizus]|nr:hypothetical protein G6F57_019751 [Rhizopus arrhizus]